MKPSKKCLQNILAGNALAVMDAGDQVGLEKLSTALLGVIRDFLDRGLPLRRIALVASILRSCHVEIPDKDRLITHLLDSQKKDGGWVDCEDTTWALSFLAGRKGLESGVEQGIRWLENELCEGSGWGFCNRDRPCIPITAQILYLLPSVSKASQAALWLESTWGEDLNSSISLNYKGAWYLLACQALRQTDIFSQALFQRTIEYLASQQREDGSWGPWKDHPATSECFITGICLAALALSLPKGSDKIIVPSLKKGIGWIKGNQLESGMFATHYIDEGSAWIYFGWSKASTALLSLKT